MDQRRVAARVFEIEYLTNIFKQGVSNNKHTTNNTHSLYDHLNDFYNLKKNSGTLISENAHFVLLTLADEVKYLCVCFCRECDVIAVNCKQTAASIAAPLYGHTVTGILAET